jgi:hypothetical protein
MHVIYLLSADETLGDYLVLSWRSCLRRLTRRRLGGLCVYTHTEESGEAKRNRQHMIGNSEGKERIPWLRCVRFICSGAV